MKEREERGKVMTEMEEGLSLVTRWQNLQEVASTKESSRLLPLVACGLGVEFPNLANNLKETLLMVHFGLGRGLIKRTSPLGS